MLISLGVILIFGILVSLICKFLKIPKVIGLLLLGILIGSHSFDIIDASLVDYSIEIRKFALIIILLKAGLIVQLDDFKYLGRPSSLMSFLPATVELLAYTLLAPLFFNISYLESALMGSVLAAVSPAVVVPKMVYFIEHQVGRAKKLPQLILAGASLDDVVVIVFFTSLLSLVQTGQISWLGLLGIPLSIIFSAIVGFLFGIILIKLLRGLDNLAKFSSKVYPYLLLLSLAFVLSWLEVFFKDGIPFSGLLAILVMAIQIKKMSRKQDVLNYSSFLSDLWIFGEILLFVLVGVQVEISYANVNAIPAAILIILTLLFRSLAVLICVVGMGLTLKEKLFCICSYLPKATVQAAIGGIPLLLGLTSGRLILSVSVLGILITAPLGASLLDKYGEKFLEGS